jgi:apolipoprotein N-acyltransferase
VKFLLERQSLRSRYLVAAIGGLLLTLAYPKIALSGFAWIAPGAMIAAATGRRGGEVFRIGYVAGLVHYLSLLYWLLLIPFRWRGLPLAPALGWLALSGFLALFPAAWVWLVASRAGCSEDRVDPDSEGVLWVRVRALRGLLARSWLQRTIWAIWGAAAWVAFEMVLARVFGGFPWALLGISQYRMVPLIQITSVTGVYGVSFLVVWVSLTLVSAGVMVVWRPTSRSLWVGEVFLPLVVIAVLFHMGLRQIQTDTPPARSIRVLLVQPSIPQTLIWNPGQDTNRFQELVRYSDQALTNKADLLVWPESALPKMLRYDQDTFDSIAKLARRRHVWLIVGSDDAEPRRSGGNPDATDYFNSSFLVSPEGKLVQRYIKRNLVIFGEYVPLQHWLPFLGYFTPTQGGFTPGAGPAAFQLAGLDVETSVLICFEDIFPQLARSHFKPETDFLVNITNDGWFGHSAAQWQHAISGLFRAVENQVPLIRCCNNGLTCWIDRRGRLRQILRDDNGTVYGMGSMIVEIPVHETGQTHPLTFYTRNGDLFGWGCVGVTGLMLLVQLNSTVRQKSK